MFGPNVEFAPDYALDEAEQVRRRIADAVVAATCGPFVQHGLPQSIVHLLQGYPGAVEQARQERDSGFEPTLETKVSNMAGYGTVYLGFPIWGEPTPPVIRSFIKAHDLSGKVLIPFVTHRGHGLGDSQLVLANHAPKAQLRRGFSLEADQERRTMNRVKDWLSEGDSKG